MAMQEIIKEKIHDLQRLCQEYDVKTMHVFDSACTDSFDDNSDIDRLIAFKEISIDTYTDNYF
jgi:hypothetical protein